MQAGARSVHVPRLRSIGQGRTQLRHERERARTSVQHVQAGHQVKAGGAAGAGDGGANAVFGKNAQNVWMTSVALSRVTGSHSLKFGFTDNWASTVNTAAANDYNMSFRFNNGIPNQLTMHGTPTRGETLIKADLEAVAERALRQNRSRRSA